MWNPNQEVEDDSWEVKAFAEDTSNAMGTTWPPRSYTCTFCKREFRSAQALGGHMNVHRRDRARLHQAHHQPNLILNPNNISSTSSSTLLIPTHQELVANGGGLCLLYSLPKPNSNFTSSYLNNIKAVAPHRFEDSHVSNSSYTEASTSEKCKSEEKVISKIDKKRKKIDSAAAVEDQNPTATGRHTTPQPPGPRASPATRLPATRPSPATRLPATESFSGDETTCGRYLHQRLTPLRLTPCDRELLRRLTPCDRYLDTYLEEGVYIGEPGVPFDALGWWKEKNLKFRILSKMAADILSIPVTTVASESAFSAGGRVIDPHRSCLGTNMVDMLICGADWYRTYYGIHKKKTKENEDYICIQLE